MENYLIMELKDSSITINTTEIITLDRKIKLSILNQNVTKMDTGFLRIIPLYSVIFFLAVIGNSLVILTLVQNKRMRTITNLFLLNLAVSDLFLGVFCMPFTLVGAILRDFVFGEIMCKLLPFLQATSVAVSAWTLVAISIERYFAICHPLRSRSWQTKKHVYKSITMIWISGFVCMIPIAILSKLIPTQQGHRKCREVWPKVPIEYEKIFNLFLDIVLLVIPLFVLGATYFLIRRTLWKGMKNEKELKKQLTRQESVKNPIEIYINGQGSAQSRCQSVRRQRNNENEQKTFHQISESTESKNDIQKKTNMPGLRRSNVEKSLLSKKRVIKMLFVVVLEFFICWTPLYVINTIALFDKRLVYKNLGYTTISFFQLLAYSSSCCNPITYCFMNCAFRKAFLNLFSCCRRNGNGRRMSIGCSTVGVDSTIIATTVKALRRPDKKTNFLSDCRDDSDHLSRNPSYQGSYQGEFSTLEETEIVKNGK